MMLNSCKRLANAAAAAVVSVMLHAGAAHAQLTSLEDAIESSTDAVILPASDAGALTLKNCEPPCAMRSIQLVEASRFFVGSTQVTYQQFSDYVHSNGPRFLMVFHQPDRPIVTRLMVSGHLQR